MSANFMRYALPTVLLLGGAPLAGFGLVAAIDGALPVHRQLPAAVATLIGLGVMFSFAFWWGRVIARASGASQVARVAWISAVTYTVTTLALVFLLGQLEQLFVEQRVLGSIPIYLIFAPLFTGAAFVMAGVMALVVGALLRGWRVGAQLAWRTGLAGGLTFLVADIVQDLLGRRVGGPNAEATFTMISVALIGNALTALVAGYVLGRALNQQPARLPAVPTPQPEALRPTAD